VFADRTSQGYLLLVDDAHDDEPTRASLQALVRKKLGKSESEPEVELLLELIAMEPPSVDPRIAAAADDAPRATRDLLGLHIELLPLHGAGGEVVPTDALTDPILTRALGDAQRKSLAHRQHALLLRADYRNQHAVRGLRLLQSLVHLVAQERNALIHDPDTGETMGADTFARRRLQASLGNVADQIAVVPFPDPLHGENYVRLSTRGMRRFGSVDLELDGLPRDPGALQSATHLLVGLAHQMVREGEFDASGYAVELGDRVKVRHDDMVRAYGHRAGVIARCENCPGEVEMHLVERVAQPHDPQGHVVARVVAPRPDSDAPDYDHPAWVQSALQALLGA
jgi:hypothetical protein